MSVSIHIASNGSREVVPLVGQNEIVNIWTPIIQANGLDLIEQAISGGLQVDENLYDVVLKQVTVLLQALEVSGSPADYPLSSSARVRRLLELLRQHPPASGNQVYIG
jgi:hypothetical protein